MSNKDKPLIPRGIASVDAGQVALNAASTTQVVAARVGRTRLIVRNLSTTITVYVGNSDEASSTGFPIFSGSSGGESGALFTEAEVFAIAASGTPSVAYIEE